MKVLMTIISIGSGILVVTGILVASAYVGSINEKEDNIGSKSTIVTPLDPVAEIQEESTYSSFVQDIVDVFKVGKKETKTTVTDDNCKRENLVSFPGLPASSPSGQWCKLGGYIVCDAAWCAGYWADQPNVKDATVIYNCNNQSDNFQPNCKEIDESDLPTPASVPNVQHPDATPFEKKKNVSGNCKIDDMVSYPGLPAKSSTGQWCKLGGYIVCDASWCGGYWADQPAANAASVVYDCNERSNDYGGPSCKKINKSDLPSS